LRRRRPCRFRSTDMDIPNASPSLYNDDLAPAARRNWGAFSIFNV